MTTNLYFGAARSSAVVEHVADRQVDVLTVLELDERSVEHLRTAGIDELLPHQYLLPLGGGKGSGIYARRPLTELGDLGEGSVMRMPRALVEVAGAQPVEVVAVHPLPPRNTHDTRAWREGLERLPAAEPSGPLRILAGDFNATLDHAELRSVVGRGYVDAADVTGDGLRPTWPTDGRLVPPVTLDHVLADRRAEVVATEVVDLPGSDHRGVFAELRLPR